MRGGRRETQAEAAGAEAQPQRNAAASAAEAEAASPAAEATGMEQQHAPASDAPANGAAMQAAPPALAEKTQAVWHAKLAATNFADAVALFLSSHEHERFYAALSDLNDLGARVLPVRSGSGRSTASPPAGGPGVPARRPGLPGLVSTASVGGAVALFPRSFVHWHTLAGLEWRLLRQSGAEAELGNGQAAHAGFVLWVRVSAELRWSFAR